VLTERNSAKMQRDFTTADRLRVRHSRSLATPGSPASERLWLAPFAATLCRLRGNASRLVRACVPGHSCGRNCRL
jgi:hypothetical protein